MPFSHSGQLSTIVRFAEGLQPLSVLDVGTGMGQYGFLLRTNLENVELFDVPADAPPSQRPRSAWRRRIDGIEGFALYRTPVHDWAYTNWIVGEALQVLSGMADRSYELVMAIDILEHFETADGLKLLGECARVASRAVLVSTPKTFIHQEVEANPLENHRSLWTEGQLAGAGYGRVLPDADSWIVVHDVAPTP
jgi:ubiquinone/menaquinone biosynthesis C-methylase UbiE